MSRRWGWGMLTSVRTSAWLLVALAVLMMLNVALPQERSLGEEAFHRLVDGSAWTRFLLVTLGLGNTPTSPVFLLVLAFFLVNLALVLGSRWGAIWRQAALRPRSEAVIRAWMRSDQASLHPLPAGWNMARVIGTLRGFGYLSRRVGEGCVWGVRHRTAPLGFLVFHISFFLLFAAGLLLYYTRFVGDVALTEGQSFAGVYRQVKREAPWGGRPQLQFQLMRVEPVFQAGMPLSLEAAFLFRAGTGSEERRSRVNHPAAWGASTILVQQAGLAPVLWLQDGEGYTVDRVSVVAMTSGQAPTHVPLAGGAIDLVIAPLAPGEDFPLREQLSTLPVQLTVTRGEDLLYDGALLPGEAASWPGGRLVLEKVNYWLGIQVVSERGGGLLIAGFVMGILGLIWRLMLYRREVAVVWDAQGFALSGRSEYFSRRFADELSEMQRRLAAVPPGQGPARQPQETGDHDE